MTDSNTAQSVFFVSTSCFYSNHKDWAKNYLYNRNYRITEMVQSVLSAEVLAFYGCTLKKYFSTNRLILRAKIYNQKQNNICLFQVWKNQECHTAFLDAIQKGLFEKAVKSIGLRVETKTQLISIQRLDKRIERMKKEKIIWQFVSGELTKKWMSLGDPIRSRKST